MQLVYLWTLFDCSRHLCYWKIYFYFMCTYVFRWLMVMLCVKSKLATNFLLEFSSCLFIINWKEKIAHFLKAISLMVLKITFTHLSVLIHPTLNLQPSCFFCSWSKHTFNISPPKAHQAQFYKHQLSHLSKPLTIQAIYPDHIIYNILIINYIGSVENQSRTLIINEVHLVLPPSHGWL